MSETFGESFTTSGWRVAERTLFTRAASASGLFPKIMPPLTTFGHETFTSIAATRRSFPMRSTTATKSSSVSPHTFAITVAPRRASSGSFSARNASTPTFCRPIAFSIPASVSQMRGGGLPWHSLRERPFTEIAPSEARSR